MAEQSSKTIYVGNLSFSSTEDDLLSLFEQYGEVISANVITDRDTGRPRGFAFVEFRDTRSAHDAVDGMDGQEFMGRTLRVNMAKPRGEPRRDYRGGDRDRGQRW